MKVSIINNIESVALIVILNQYRIAGMFRGVKVSFFKEKTIFVGFIFVLI